MEECSLGKILQIYRKSMSIENVAHILNRDVKEIEAWEKGEKIPDTYTKALLAKLYNIPFGLLMYSNSNRIDAVINCRAVGDFNELPDEYKVIFTNKVYNLSKMIELYGSEVKPLTYDKFININDNEIKIMSKAVSLDNKVKRIIENKAGKLRQYYNYDLSGSLKEFLDKVLKSSLNIIFSKMPEGYSGVSFKPNKDHNYFIFINSGDHYCKQVFTLLHEMGHIIFIDIQNPSLIEDFVDYFANMVLLPKKDIKNTFKNKDFSVSNIREYINEIKSISAEYEVSYKTIFYSLHHLNLIKDTDINGTFKEFVNKIVLTYFNEEYNLTKASYRYNTTLNRLQKTLLERNLLTDEFVLQMNFGKPFVN